MRALLSFDPVSVGGAALAVACLLLRVPRRRTWGALVGVLAAALAALACLAGQIGVLALAWMAASVAVSGRDRLPSRSAGPLGPGEIRTAVGVLGDGIAVAAFAGLALDSGAGRLPWSGGPQVLPAWVPALVALGIATRSLASGMREPGLLVVASVIGARLSATGLEGLDAPALVALAPLAAVVAWEEGTLVALPMLGGSLFGVGHPAALEAAALLFAGGAVAVTGVAFAGAPAVEGRWRLAVGEGPPGGVTAGGLTLLAAVPAAIGLLQVPLASTPEAAVAMAATLAVLGGAGAGAGARRLRSEAFSLRSLASVTAVCVLALGLLTPGGTASALDLAAPRGSVVAGALSGVRGGLVSAGAFAASLTALVFLASRPRRGAGG